MIDIKKNFGKRLKELRVKEGLTQELLAEKISLSARMVSSVENGKAFVSSEVIENLCKAFEVSPKYFFDDAEIIKNSDDLSLTEEIKKRVDELSVARLKDIYNIIVALS